MIDPSSSIKRFFSYFKEEAAHFITDLFQQNFAQRITHAPLNPDRVVVYELPITPAPLSNPDIAPLKYDRIKNEIFSLYTEEQKETLAFKEKMLKDLKQTLRNRKIPDFIHTLHYFILAFEHTTLPVSNETLREWRIKSNSLIDYKFDNLKRGITKLIELQMSYYASPPYAENTRANLLARSKEVLKWLKICTRSLTLQPLNDRVKLYVPAYIYARYQNPKMAMLNDRIKNAIHSQYTLEQRRMVAIIENMLKDLSQTLQNRSVSDPAPTLSYFIQEFDQTTLPVSHQKLYRWCIKLNSLTDYKFDELKNNIAKLIELQMTYNISPPYAENTRINLLASSNEVLECLKIDIKKLLNF